MTPPGLHLPAIPLYPIDATLPLDRACALAIEEVAQNIAAFHKYTLFQDGGLPGVRPGSSPVTAASRPFTVIGGEWAFQNGLLQAGAFLQAVTQSHIYLDGNKRTAFMSGMHFLSECHYWQQPIELVPLHRVELKELEDLVLRIASEGDDLADKRITHPYTVEDVALALHEILAPSRKRSLTIMRRGRVAKGVWRTLGGALRGNE